MRRLLGALCMSVMCGCNPTVNFDVTSSSSAQVGGIGGLPLTNFPLISPPIDIAQQTGFSSAQTAKDRIQSARATKLTLSVTNPAGADLSFLTAVQIKITAGTQSVEIAHLSPLPAASSADLVLDDVDLAPYLKAPSFTLTTVVSGTTPSKVTTIQGALTANIEATVF